MRFLKELKTIETDKDISKETGRVRRKIKIKQKKKAGVMKNEDDRITALLLNPVCFQLIS